MMIICNLSVMSTDGKEKRRIRGEMGNSYRRGRGAIESGRWGNCCCSRGTRCGAEPDEASNLYFMT